MDPFIAMLVLFLLVALGLFILLRQKPRTDDSQSRFFSLVSRQHLEVFQGEEFPLVALEKTKRRFIHLMEEGESKTIERMLQGGLDFIVQVRALTEIGTFEAAKILENTFGKTLSRDPMEQEWFSIDLARALRTVNREKILPHMLRYLKVNQHGYHHLLAGELICFLSFEGYLRNLEEPSDNLALNAVCLALQGIRAGNSPSIIGESRMGDLLGALWDNRHFAKKQPSVDPLLALVFNHALKLVKRLRGLKGGKMFVIEGEEEFEWQITRMESLEIQMEQYLEIAKKNLCQVLALKPLWDHPQYLQAIFELRCPPSLEMREWLLEKTYPCKTAVLECFSFAKENLSPFLLEFAKGLKTNWGDTKSIRREKDACLEAVSRCLRYHPSVETEKFLVRGILGGKRNLKIESMSSLGWWEPFDRGLVIGALKKYGTKNEMELRYGAVSALARLGERKALQWLRNGLWNEDSFIVHQTIHTIAHQGISLLWPDLDQLVDAPDGDVAIHAREAIANLSEELHS